MTTRLTQSTSLLLDINILVTFAEDIIYLYISKCKASSSFLFFFFSNSFF